MSWAHLQTGFHKPLEIWVLNVDWIKHNNINKCAKIRDFHPSLKKKKKSHSSKISIFELQK